MHPAVALRHPFLTAEQAAFFLEVPIAEACRMFDDGELPQAKRLDGGPFQPTRGHRLIPYDEFHASVDDDKQGMLELWQRGRYDVPKVGATEAAPADFRTVLLSLFESDAAIDQAGKV